MINAEPQSRSDAEKIENLLSERVLDAAIEVHRTLGGPGLLESLYGAPRSAHSLAAGRAVRKEAPTSFCTES
jgi:hypothetical protein